MALRAAVEPSPDREYDKRTPDLDAPTTTFVSGLIHPRSAWNRNSQKVVPSLALMQDSSGAHRRVAASKYRQAKEVELWERTNTGGCSQRWRS